MPRSSSRLALCAAFALSSPAFAVETLQQMDAEPRDVSESPHPGAADETRPATAAPEPVADPSGVSGIATAGLEAGEPVAPAASQIRAASPAPLQRLGSRWNAFLPGMVR